MLTITISLNYYFCVCAIGVKSQEWSSTKLMLTGLKDFENYQKV